MKTTKPNSNKESKCMEDQSTHVAAATKSKGTMKTKTSSLNDETVVDGGNSDVAPSSSKDVRRNQDTECSTHKCKKAKLIRLERRKAKMVAKGMPADDDETERANKEKKLEDLINEVESLKKLEITLVRTDQQESNDIKECFQLYEKYQTIIHNDDYNDMYGFKQFLVMSPLNITKHDDSEAPSCGYGTFHQLYRLDGKLIAYGVLDILPRCVSSVYFVYDPDYLPLSLGTYGAVRELELTRKLAEECPSLTQYYLGFYIHSCQKMRYKGQWKPSYLLCPEAYTYHPISECLSKLDVSPYSRLNEDLNAKSEEDDVDISGVQLVKNYGITCVRDCDSLSGEAKSIINRFARLVGQSVAHKLFLRLPEWEC